VGRAGVPAYGRVGVGDAGGHRPVQVHQVHSVYHVHLRLAMPRHAAVSSVLIYPVFDLDQRTLDLIDAFS
jgi:hypothetical protein